MPKTSLIAWKLKNNANKSRIREMLRNKCLRNRHTTSREISIHLCKDITVKEKKDSYSYFQFLILPELLEARRAVQR